MRALCFGNICESILVPTGTTIILCETIPFINVNQIRILLQIIGYVAVFVIIMHRSNNIRISFCPIRSSHGTVTAGSFGCVNRKIGNVRPGEGPQFTAIFQMVHHVSADKSA